MDISKYILEEEKRALKALQTIISLCDEDGKLFAVGAKAFDLKWEIAREIGCRIIDQFLEGHGDS